MHNDASLQAFATPVFTRCYDDTADLNARLLELVRALERRGPSDDRHRSHQGGFYTPGTLFQDCRPPLSEVRDMLRAAVRSYIDQVAAAGHGRKRAIPGRIGRINHLFVGLHRAVSPARPRHLPSAARFRSPISA